MSMLTRIAAGSACVLSLAALFAREASAQESAAFDEYRVEITLAHPIAGRFAGQPFVRFDDQTVATKVFRVEFPSVIYRATQWLQGSSGISGIWNQVEEPGSSTRELRPYVGVKVSVPNSAHVRLYDLSRFEWRRITNTDTDSVTREVRFRTRPSVEFPLSLRAWQPGTFYGLANVETLVQHGFVDELRFASGAGHVTRDRMRIEVQYVAYLTRKSPSEALEYSRSSFRLNVRFSLAEGLLHLLEDPQ